MKEEAKDTNENSPLGVVDSLSAGLSLIASYPQLLFLPALVDFFFWLSPPLVLGKGLITTIVAATGRLLNPQGTNATAVPEHMIADAKMFQETLHLWLENVNLWLFLVPPFLFWPSVLADVPNGYWALQGQAMQIDNVLGLLVPPVFLVAGLFFALLWLNGVLYAISRTGWLSDVGLLLRRTVKQGARLLGIAILLLALVVGIFVPVAFVTAIIMLLAPGVGEFVVNLLVFTVVSVGFWLIFHLFFTPAAVVMADMSLLEAPRWSFKLVRRFFWSTFGFVALSLLLTLGFQLIWLRLGNTAPGLALSIVANAALGTAIAAAMLIFFRERSRALMAEMAS